MILSAFIHKYDDVILFYIWFHRPFASLNRATPVKWSPNLTGQAENAEVIIILRGRKTITIMPCGHLVPRIVA